MIGWVLDRELFSFKTFKFDISADIHIASDKSIGFISIDDILSNL
jgi:hypothetical protein